MHILIVGNITKDVYLNLDTRTETLETDQNHVKWLNLSFNASEHRFFNRECSLGGSAISLEVLENMGLSASISGSKLSFQGSIKATEDSIKTHRYILLSDGQVSYLSPSSFQATDFSIPAETIDYLFVDRSAKLNHAATKKILAYLSLSQGTKLVLYLHDLSNPNLNQLIPHANLLFLENNRGISEKLDALKLTLDPKKLIHISENQLSYLDITENLSLDRIDMFTHLSLYSIASATILGGFILGYSVEESLKMARANLKNSKLNSTLSLEELKNISEQKYQKADLELITANLMLKPKGILAADESGGSIKKKFATLNIPDTYENRRDYRNLFFTTPDLEKYINGVILFDETARQTADNGRTFVNFLINRRIIPGIKVDQGLAPLSEITSRPEDAAETYTKGLDHLEPRLKEYYALGLRFAKWRAAFNLQLSDTGTIITPSKAAIEENCRILAEYAKTCQAVGLVPIVEPELVYDGLYSIDQSAEVTSTILDCLFQHLASAEVNLHACILKTNMVLAGKQFNQPSTPEEVGQKTAAVLKNHVPNTLGGIVFLSGGQTTDQATNNLTQIMQNGPFPWPLTFSFARALQDPALYAWRGNNQNSNEARSAFLDRLVANTDALKI